MGSYDHDNLTPMFRQYFDLKDKYPGSLLLFRCGDFYEMYGEDAVRGAEAMEIVVTSREMGRGGRIEMAGVPYHALDNYLKLLIGKGVKVAICEQLEDPRMARGLVKRDVVRVITSGTVLDPAMLAEDKNNYLIGLSTYRSSTGIAVTDVSTGEMRVTGVNALDFQRLKDEIYRVRPSEVVIQDEMTGMEIITNYLSELRIPYSVSNEPVHGEIFREILRTVFDEEKLALVEWDVVPEAGEAAALVINYLTETQKTSRHSLNRITYYNLADYMVLDASTWRNLELTHTMMGHQKKGSLLWAMDETKTPMGARLLRSKMEHPLLDMGKIKASHDAVEELAGNYTLLELLISRLKTIQDLERITSKVIYGSANARDLLALGNSIAHLPKLKEILEPACSSLLRVLGDSLDTLEDIHRIIHDSIASDPPQGLKEGNLIRDGYHAELDELRQVRSGAKQWIADLEQKEREKTGIKSLKVRFNNVFGYFIEITRPNLSMVPVDYIRKQTIANGERFISPELKEYESKVLGAEEKIIDLEYNLFVGIRESIGREASRIQESSQVIAHLDVLASFASVAMRHRYCRPRMVPESVISIHNGRHPVVERFLSEGFVPNDTEIGSDESRFHVITGPNMSGKSTYLRQIGLITIMAQMGSFVPADSAVIGIADRVFTRVGASDDLHLGKSTFMVEMSETANIVKNATRTSLILLDEIGRGTSTYDGLSIAWSVSEYIHNRIQARTFFATHFHQLTELADHLEGVKNFRVDVKETNREVIFLHRIVPGGTDKSYGIYVAQLAGFPPSILNRAKEILDQLESSYEDHRKSAMRDDGGGGNGKGSSQSYQMTFFDMIQSPLADELQKINPDDLSPREALDKLYELKRKLK